MLMCLGDEAPSDDFWSSTEQANGLNSAPADQMNLEKNVLMWTKVNFPPVF